MSNDEACLEAGISRACLYEYLSNNPKFKERVEMLKNRPVIIARKCVVDSLKDDSDLSLKYLERKKKDEFSTKTEVEQNVTFEPVTITFEDNTEKE